MQKLLLSFGLAMVVAPTVTLAQQAPWTGGPGYGLTGNPPMQGGGPDGSNQGMAGPQMGGMMGQMRGMGSMGGGMGMREMGGRERGEWDRWHHHEAAGAMFFLRRGADRTFIRCSPVESMQACVAAATALMDKVQAMQPPASAQKP